MQVDKYFHRFAVFQSNILLFPTRNQRIVQTLGHWKSMKTLKVIIFEDKIYFKGKKSYIIVP